MPAVAVTVDSAATSSFWAMLLPAIIFVWGGDLSLSKLEKIFLCGFVIFSLAMALSLVNAEIFSESLGSYERYSRFLFFVPIYLFVKRFGLRLAPIMSWGLMLGCLAIGLVAIYQYYILGFPQPMGARQINRFGFTAVTIFLLFFLQVVFNWRGKWSMIAAAIVSLIIIYGIILNNTRGAMLCVFPFILLLVFYFRNDFDKKKQIY